jgi:signal transduction histidine kinase
MLWKLNSSFENKRLFAQNAAHELKTPLASIMANIDVLELDKEPTSDEYRELIDIIRISTERLIELVKGLLSLNTVMDESQCQLVNIKQAIEIIIADLHEMISQKNINVVITGECEIKGDKALLERALLNLIHNAVRYNIKSGNVTITLSSDTIVIEDNGVGIPSDCLEHIFEPFYCVDKSRSKKLGGHGLGMTIAKSILDKHNIDICVFSEVSKGTRIIMKKQNP